MERRYVMRGLVVALLAAACWVGLRGSREASIFPDGERGLPRRSARGDGADGSVAERSRKARVAAVLGRKWLDPRMEKLMDEDVALLLDVGIFADYLKSEGRRPGSLVAVYKLTNDPGLLDELRALGDSEEALLCLGQKGRDPQEKVESLRRYVELCPSDPTGYLLLANLLGDSMEDAAKRGELLQQAYAARGAAERRNELLRQVSTAWGEPGGFMTMRGEMMAALEASGYSATEAEIHLFHDRESERLLSDCLAPFLGALEDAVYLAKTGEDRSRAFTEFVTGAGYLQWRVVTGEGNLAAEAFTTQFYKTMEASVENLPVDTVVDDHGATAGQMTEAFGKELREMSELNEVFRKQFARDASAGQVDEFFKIRRESGYQAAYQWMTREMDHWPKKE